MIGRAFPSIIGGHEYSRTWVADESETLWSCDRKFVLLCFLLFKFVSKPAATAAQFHQVSAIKVRERSICSTKEHRDRTRGWLVS
jgi:hypothetical protein